MNAFVHVVVVVFKAIATEVLLASVKASKMAKKKHFRMMVVGRIGCFGLKSLF